jgi:hypothetical protein
MSPSRMIDSIYDDYKRSPLFLREQGSKAQHVISSFISFGKIIPYGDSQFEQSSSQSFTHLAEQRVPEGFR